MKNSHKSYGMVCKDDGFCEIVLPSQKDNVLKVNKYVRPDKTLYIF